MMPSTLSMAAFSVTHYRPSHSWRTYNLIAAWNVNAAREKAWENAEQPMRRTRIAAAMPAATLIIVIGAPGKPH
jgi:hypothetical protein